MAAGRSTIPITVLNSAGVPVNAATVAITRRPSGSASVYATETSVGTISATRTTDVMGRPSGWMESGAYQATISGSGITTYTEYFDITPGELDAGVTIWPDPMPAPATYPAGTKWYYYPGGFNGPVWALVNVASGGWQCVGGSPLRVSHDGPIVMNSLSSHTIVPGFPIIAFTSIGLYTMEMYGTVSSSAAAPQIISQLRVNGSDVFSGSPGRRVTAYAGGARSNFGARRGGWNVTSTAHDVSLFMASTVTINLTLYDATVSIMPERLG